MRSSQTFTVEQDVPRRRSPGGATTSGELDLPLVALTHELLALLTAPAAPGDAEPSRASSLA
ncbi:hypothetical protein [Kineosporia succinea]|uniref:FXSXX-COOH protein n=1 Tax=Kineosporia succinea TaxID=84632 RepID=A0ABT9PD73_9ACTN|nr:hypothetical protein [Kineosporia succinea]MDP9830666.1 hypothetical protein [Kineosporia succinea]